jgi:hypothetical protein
MGSVSMPSGRDVERGEGGEGRSVASTCGLTN